MRVTPLVQQYPLNDKLYYPVYATCAELGLPVSINVGIPGPRVRSACQHPELLEDVLIDFKGLTVIGAHMGHPYESLLMQYMLKWPDLYLSNSAYLAKYMDPALVSFMNSGRGAGRVLYASDHPFLPMERAVAAARDSASLRCGGRGLPRRHGSPPVAPGLRPRMTASAAPHDRAGTVRAWISVGSACGGAAPGGIPTNPTAAWRPSSNPSVTGPCGRRDASTPVSRRTSRSCWTRPTTFRWRAASSASGPAAPEEVGPAVAALEERFPDRFLLGIGASHSIAVADYSRPYSKVVAYLDALDALPIPVPRSGRVLAALGPRMLELAAARTAGAHPYFVPVEHTAFARDILGPGPLLAPEVAVVLETDPVRGPGPGPRLRQHVPRPAQLHAEPAHFRLR